jgi:hypothetical protein
MVDHALRAHEDYAASAADQWMNCAGSIGLCAGLPEQRSPYAEEGTRAHEVLEVELRCLLGGNDGADVAEAQAVWAAIPQHERAEMRDGVDAAINYVEARLAECPDARIWIEKRVKVSSRAAPGRVGGTSDIMIYYPSLGLLEVIDFKYGAGVAVEVIGNKQMRIYGLGAYEMLQLNVSRIKVTIIQPRAFHPDGPIRSEEFDLVELLDFHADVEEAIEQTLLPNPTFTPGPKQCRWCNGRTICPAIQARAVGIAGQDFRSMTIVEMPSAKGLTPDQLGYILASKDMVVGYFKAVEEEAYRLALDGTQIPGQKLVAAIGRRAFEGTTAEVSAALGAITGLPASEFTEESLLGITETEKLIKTTLKPKGKDAVSEAMKQFAFLTTKKSSGKLQLVGLEDTRPAVNPASEAFKGVVMLPHITGE